MWEVHYAKRRDASKWKRMDDHGGSVEMRPWPYISWDNRQTSEVFEDDAENGIEGNVTALSTAGEAIDEPDFVARPEELLDPIDEQFEDDADEGVPAKQNSNRNHKKKRKNRRWGYYARKLSIKTG